MYDNDGNLLIKISSSLEENISNLKRLFYNCDDIVQKSFLLERGSENGTIYIVYVDGLTNDELVDNVIIKPLSYEWRGENKMDLWDSIYYMEAQTVDIKEETDLQKIVMTILKGDTAIFVDGYDKVMLVSSKKFPLRAITENNKEASIRGPKDAFNESLRTSTALIRRRFRDTRLKVEQGVIGRRSQTDYAIMYISDVVAPGLVEGIKNRIEKYDIDAVFDSGMVEQLIEEKWYSPFPIMQSTSRPDKAAAAIAEGRAVVEAGLVSTIVVIIVALTAIASFSIPNEEFASVFRLIKFLIIITSVILGLYVFILGLLVLAIHLSEITSFGIPYLMPLVSGSVDGARANQDFVFKSPIQAMKKRPVFANKGNKTRLKKK